MKYIISLLFLLFLLILTKSDGQELPENQINYKSLFHTKNVKADWYFCLKNNENFTYSEDTLTLHRELIKPYVPERRYVYCNDFAIILDFNKRNTYQQYWGYSDQDPVTLHYKIKRKKNGKHYLIFNNFDKYEIHSVYGNSTNGYYKIVLVKIRENK